MIVQHEERVGPWRSFPHYGWDEVRVWYRLTPFGMFQRHEWRGAGGHRADEWIPNPMRRFSAEAQPTNETIPSEPDILLEVVRRIAQGHNDPRSLATETLAALGLAHDDR